MDNTSVQPCAPASAPVLEATDLHKTFRDFWGRPRAEAVRGVSLRAEKGEVLGILGPNGSGKSTTIKMILGLTRPTGGSVRIFGLPSSAKGARARIGYLPELSQLHPFLTPRETLFYAAGLFNMEKAAARERVGQLLEKVGISSADADRKVGEFSKGMARRVGLARALLNDPDFVVLDEPTSGLDPVGRREVKDLVRGLGAEGRTVLMSSHLLAEVQDVCSRVAVLVRGLVRAEGSLPGLLEMRSGPVRFDAEGLPEEKTGAACDALRALGAASVAASRPTRQLEDFFLELLRRSGEA
ncbi:MAG: ABC transporter ATP-binding protein [Kiritimatiellae bacterium]|nr:ABC transporter ATP-binding protein [Kiritimatiellia bacterium]